jgi:mono/diheme cytochrome c family protein
VLRGGNADAIERVLSVAAEEKAPEWAQAAVLAGVRHFLPKTPEGKSMPGLLPAEPKPLLALAAKTNVAAAGQATQLIEQLKWPGKPGAADVAVRPLTAAEQQLFEKGRTQFTTLCAACHQVTGQGLPGLAPPLVYSKWALGDPRVLARIVLNGKTQQNLIMPPWKGLLDDEGIAAVLTFIRRSWGHEADPVDVATVAAARRDTRNRDEPWTEADLQELVKELGIEMK